MSLRSSAAAQNQGNEITRRRFFGKAPVRFRYAILLERAEKYTADFFVSLKHAPQGHASLKTKNQI